jgi:diguanylate cyclase (GGDEF)-like protein
MAGTLRFSKLTAPGFDDPSAISLLQDRQGFVWIGTSTGGLYRYDGYQALHYIHHPGDSHSLAHDRVSALHEDTRGRLWAATQNGIVRYNPSSNDFTAFAPASGPNNFRIVKSIVSDGKDGMWLATWGGLQHFDPASGRFRQYVHEAGRPGSLAWNDTNALALDRRGGLWVATWPGGLDYLAPGASDFVHFRIDRPGSADDKMNVARALHFDGRGRLWIGTEAGIVRWDSSLPWDSRRQVVTPGGRVTNIYSDHDGTLWVASLNAGLMRWDQSSDSFYHYRHRGNDEYSVPADHIQALLEDRSGMLWVGSYTDGIGLANLNSRGFTRYLPHHFDSDDAAPASNAMNAMADAGDGRLWLGGSSGVSLFDPASGEILFDAQGDAALPGALSDTLVYSLYKGREGPLWIGTSAGLNRLDRAGGAFSTVHFDGLANDYINVIAPGHGGVLWLGTGNDLIRYDPATGARRLYAANPADGASRSIKGSTVLREDSRGWLWAGSEWNGGGLDLMQDSNSGVFRHFRHSDTDPDSLSDDNVTAVFEDRQGRIWVGTAKGLNQIVARADGGFAIQPVSAMAYAKIFAISADDDGRIWVSTAAGLSRIDPENARVGHFTTADGLAGGFLSGSVVAMRGGKLYFGGVRGITGVDPRAVRSVSVPPQVAITDISVFNRSLRGGRSDGDVDLRGPVTAPAGLTLSAHASVFSIEFAALHFTEPASNRYAYRLEGFDRDWVQADAAHHSATYTNLAAGHYVFRVKASNYLGQWSDEAATVPVTILPPYWASWWFRAAAILLALGALGGIYRWRIARLTRHQAELETLVAVRTSELQESNRKLAALSATDGLTGIANRRGFDIALEAEWRRGARNVQPLALVMIDVDHFKKYNDHYGHLAGDHCLRNVAKLIGSHGRRTSDLVARYGGEEFALLAAATTAADALAIAEALCADVRRLALPHEQSPFGIITISAGVASMVPGDGKTAEMLVSEADQVMYRAKAAGRNQAMLGQAPANHQADSAGNK